MRCGERRVGSALVFCVHVCVWMCMYVPALLLWCVQISSSAAVSSCGAKRPSGDSSSTCCWAPQGMDWALQAGILSIQPLQAAWETGDTATDSLCLLVYCWASVLGGTAGLTGGSANQSSSSSPTQSLSQRLVSCLLSLRYQSTVLPLFSHWSLHKLDTSTSLCSCSFPGLWRSCGTPTLSTCCPLR